MKKRVYLLTALVIFATHTIINFAAMTNEVISDPIENIWSNPINGLSGRLRVEFENLNPGLRHAVYLELINHSLNSVAVINQPRIHAEVFDTTGKPLSASGFPMSGPIPNPQWAVIPRDAYIGFRIDMQTVGVPTSEQGVVLLAVGGKSWALKAGEYVLKATLVIKKEANTPPNQWVGELKLLPVGIVITPEMLAIK